MSGNGKCLHGILGFGCSRISHSCRMASSSNLHSSTSWSISSWKSLGVQPLEMGCMFLLILHLYIWLYIYIYNLKIVIFMLALYVWNYLIYFFFGGCCCFKKDQAVNKKVTPFGGGLRLCPGADLAKVETAFFLHHLVLNYR